MTGKEPGAPATGCPKCGSSHIGGLMMAFWVPLRADGSPAGDWDDWSSESEVGESRMCYDCDHTWELGDV